MIGSTVLQKDWWSLYVPCHPPPPRPPSSPHLKRRCLVGKAPVLSGEETKKKIQTFLYILLAMQVFILFVPHMETISYRNFSVPPVFETHVFWTAHLCWDVQSGLHSGRAALVICRDNTTPFSCHVTNTPAILLLYSITGSFCSLPYWSRKLPEKEWIKISTMNTRDNWREPISHRNQPLYWQSKYISYNVRLYKKVTNHSPHNESLFKNTLYIVNGISNRTFT